MLKMGEKMSKIKVEFEVPDGIYCHHPLRDNSCQFVDVWNDRCLMFTGKLKVVAFGKYSCIAKHPDCTKAEIKQKVEKKAE